MTDTLLNVFLAIAVDNLGNAQALTAAEERAELSGQVHKNCSVWQKKSNTFEVAQEKPHGGAEKHVLKCTVYNLLSRGLRDVLRDCLIV